MEYREERLWNLTFLYSFYSPTFSSLTSVAAGRGRPPSKTSRTEPIKPEAGKATNYAWGFPDPMSERQCQVLRIPRETPTMKNQLNRLSFNPDWRMTVLRTSAQYHRQKGVEDPHWRPIPDSGGATALCAGGEKTDWQEFHSRSCGSSCFATSGSSFPPCTNWSIAMTSSRSGCSMSSSCPTRSLSSTLHSTFSSMWFCKLLSPLEVENTWSFHLSLQPDFNCDQSCKEDFFRIPNKYF